MDDDLEPIAAPQRGRPKKKREEVVPDAAQLAATDRVTTGVQPTVQTAAAPVFPRLADKIASRSAAPTQDISDVLNAQIVMTHAQAAEDFGREAEARVAAASSWVEDRTQPSAPVMPVISDVGSEANISPHPRVLPKGTGVLTLHAPTVEEVVAAYRAQQPVAGAPPQVPEVLSHDPGSVPSDRMSSWNSPAAHDAIGPTTDHGRGIAGTATPPICAPGEKSTPPLPSSADGIAPAPTLASTYAVGTFAASPAPPADRQPPRCTTPTTLDPSTSSGSVGPATLPSIRQPATRETSLAQMSEAELEAELARRRGQVSPVVNSMDIRMGDNAPAPVFSVSPAAEAQRIAAIAGGRLVETASPQPNLNPEGGLIAPRQFSKDPRTWPNGEQRIHDPFAPAIVQADPEPGYVEAEVTLKDGSKTTVKVPLSVVQTVVAEAPPPDEGMTRWRCLQDGTPGGGGYVPSGCPDFWAERVPGVHVRCPRCHSKTVWEMAE